MPRHASYFRVAEDIGPAVHETIIYMAQIQLSCNLATNWRYLVKDVTFMIFAGPPHRAVFTTELDDACRRLLFLLSALFFVCHFSP